ncbi:dorsal-ventral patterning protein Sog isoform X1 [Cotesia glomerata]|uniref:dorsal-ventral patterning protein Sog isoform X1 n=1 Tax=Cotesia glomerata TaxID=32391 RepID=UPI001D01AD3C|nr:dorsal-ventral patterning protein Sog isoform X1 [Cotesia glomerata]
MYVQTSGSMLAILLALIAAGGSVVGTEGKRVAPLIDDDWTKRPHRAAECTFGKQLRELGSTWYADLGPPFGVMYCIKCECIPIQKKRRIVARVQCRNIKNECPKLNCEEPVLLPGKCCKSCPGEYSVELAQDLPIQQNVEEEERNFKYFGTLISGKTSRQIVDSVNESTNYLAASEYVATGRFTFNRKNLYYSFYLSASTPRPRSIQFIDNTGSILEEQTIDPVGGVYQNATGKLCGVWRRVPRDYRKLMREEQLYVSLIWETPTTATTSKALLVGQLTRYKALSTEQFSSLLEPAMGVDRTLMYGAAGTAIISVSSASAPSIHVSLVFNGLFLPNDILDVPLLVTIEHQEKDYVLLQEAIIVDKPSSDVNFGEVRSALSATDLRLLSRGKLSITVASKKDPQAVKLTGTIGTRATCDMYQALLPSEPSRHASGLAWAYLDRYGVLKYGVKLAGLDEESPLVTLVDDGGKRKTELEDLTPTLIGGSTANGSLDRPGPRLLETLFKGELSVVASSPAGAVLRGRLSQRHIADAKDTCSPALLTSSVSGSVVGLIWLAIDTDCSLHYELELTGLPEDDQKDIGEDEEDVKNRRLYLETVPLLVEGAPVSRRLLEEFDGNILEGSVTGLSLIELFRIDSGIGFLEVVEVDGNTSTKLVRTKFKARAPLSCLPHYADNDVASVLVYNPHSPSSELESTSCFHETKFYEEGTQWTAHSDPCSMCHCHRGTATCDPVPCPPLSCPVSLRIKPPAGHCCSICQLPSDNTTRTTPNPMTSTMSSKKSSTEALRGCTLAGQFHVAGAAWHPYLPPSGFDTCAICTCDPINLIVRCPRVQCPALDCDEKTAIRPDKKACCKQCPVVNVIPISGTQGPITSDPSLPRDQAIVQSLYVPKRTPEDILADGGCRYPVGGPYENGRDWHPKIHSHGEIKCVKCRCKNGEVKCDRKRCPRSLCNSIVNQLKRGERIPEADDCCTVQCKRSRRHHRNHRNHHHHSNNHNHHHHQQQPQQQQQQQQQQNQQQQRYYSSSASPKTSKYSMTSRDLS